MFEWRGVGLKNLRMARGFGMFSCWLNGLAASLAADDLAMELHKDSEGAEVNVVVGRGLKCLGLEEGSGRGLGGLGVGGKVDQAGERSRGKPFFVVGGERADICFDPEAGGRRSGRELDDLTVGVEFEPTVEFGSGGWFKVRKPIVWPYSHSERIRSFRCFVNIFELFDAV